MYKTILVPLDGSTLAEAILPHVEQLAALCGASVIFLQVIELPHLVPDKGEGFEALPHLSAADVEKQVNDAQTYLEALTERVRDNGLTAHFRVEYGPIVTTILRLAEQEAVDLIAMASHGRGGLTDVYYGSVAGGVLQRIDRPLLIVRTRP